MILYFDENLPLHLMKGFDVLQKKEGLRTGNPVTLPCSYAFPTSNPQVWEARRPFAYEIKPNRKIKSLN
jgi:hypothetical protein